MNGSLTEHQAANEANCVSALEFLKIANKTLQRTGNSAAFLFGLNKKTTRIAVSPFAKYLAPGGYSPTFYTGRLRPKVQPKTSLEEEVPPFISISPTGLVYKLK